MSNVVVVSSGVHPKRVCSWAAPAFLFCGGSVGANRKAQDQSQCKSE